ncbi:unnamed protein product [Candida verbasci]|uniref:Uncharacterized protein n=1 Tax=Candida verbasci TaxID=1227364 RepID=A0A9W4XB14_9ASCO|nr:unnamed protein product [Candida verbasci]
MFADIDEKIGKDDDMFASDNENTTGRSNGNEKNSEEEGEDFDDDYYNSVEDFENREFRNKNLPKIEAFSMKDDEGIVDEDGNYLPQKEESDEEEKWLDEYKNSDIKKAKQAQQERLEKLNESKSVNMEPIDEILSELIELLEPVETSFEALARLNIKIKKKNKKTQDQQLQTQIKKDIQRITDLCSILSNKKSMNDVYDLTKEELMRLYERETGKSYNRGIKRPREEEENEEVNQEVEDYGEKHTR